ncbi:hypothetical protein C8Q80DRAFT_187315 [Daedaleopsis nitida]|nr:hypothetical protein C8Q80DRAFT_187315 [Daedaleopsis nitida]
MLPIGAMFLDMKLNTKSYIQPDCRQDHCTQPLLLSSYHSLVQLCKRGRVEDGLLGLAFPAILNLHQSPFSSTWLQLFAYQTRMCDFPWTCLAQTKTPFLASSPPKAPRRLSSVVNALCP